MKPLKLKLKGLNSFIEEQTIDFEKLTQKGLFGIFGPTGSGKSTILDGITLCLYGEVSRKSSDYINTNVELLQVSFEFQISNTEIKKYRVHREFKRDKLGNIRTKLARILDITSGEEIVLEESVRQVTVKCEEIIGLNLDDFTRTVVLPQGRFSEFLKLQGKDRRDMLERLFNLEKYGDGLSNKLVIEIRRYRKMENELVGQLKGFEDISQDILEHKKLNLSCIEVELEKNNNELIKIKENYIKSKELWIQQEELKTYNDKLVKLKLREEEIEKGKLKLKLGESANAVKPYMESYENTKIEVVYVEDKLQKLQTRFKLINTQRADILEQFESILKDKEEKLPILNQKLIHLEEAVSVQEVIDKLVKERVELRDIISTLELEIESTNQTIQDFDENITRLNLEILHKEDESEKRNVPYEYRENLRLALSLEERILEKINNKLQVEENIELLSRNIDKQEYQYNNLKVEQKACNESIESVTRELEQLIATCPGDHELILHKRDQLNISIQKWDYYNELSGSLTLKERKYEGLIKSLKEKYIDKNLLVLELDKLKLIVEKLEKENIAYTLRNNLLPGEYCPVCGSEDHHLDRINHIDATQLNKYQNEYNNQNIKINNLDREITTLETNRNIEENSIKEVKRNLEELGVDFLNTKVEKIQVEYDDLKEKVVSFETQKSSLEKKLYNMKEEKNKIDVSSSVLEANLIQNRDYKEKYTQEFKQINQNLNVDQKQLNKYQIDLKVVDIKKTRDDIIKKDKEISELQASIKKAREIIEIKINKREKLRVNNSLLRENYAKQKVALVDKERNIVEKETSIIEKLGNISDLRFELKNITGSIEAIKNNYIKVENQKKIYDEEYSNYNEQIIINQNSLISLQKRAVEDKKTLDIKLKEHDFVNLADVKNYLLPINEIKSLQDEIEQYTQILNKLTGTMESIVKKIDGKSITLNQWERIQSDQTEKEAKVKELEETKFSLYTEINTISNRLDIQKSVLKDKINVDKKLGLLNDLEKLFKGKRFVEYVATHQLQYVSMEASKKLKEITGGNYGIEVDENGKFIIRDYKNGGAKRDATTLSGGETFLASLALALALSAQIQLKGTAPLELFFLDEGFGTLDDNILEVVMDSLETIHNDKLSIGIISHVESIKNRVPIKLLIKPAVSGLGGSKVNIEYS
ncbi:AAA family ATPase [Alkalibaculum sp. M08DMB]|uniref:Nuclease SbcCD subunit C n=1 Tax=Alkalibaculum sporogenes TaxID=2655001 RepID=A0A6A7K5B4_9FIRM|nr:AAA family ATPase [Alkalibaculum sporogenes]MPW24551.1 AAA family ATPase [Alkalibaculum sporogenes]